MVGRESDRKRAVRALCQRLDLAAREIAAQRGDQRLLTRLGREVRDPRGRIELEQVRAAMLEGVGRERLGEAAVERDDERPVVLVAVAVEHDDDPLEPRHHAKRLAHDELGVLERDLGRKQRLRHAARLVHRVEAEPAREVGQEVQPAPRQLRPNEKPRREQRLDPVRARASGLEGRRCARPHVQP